MQFCWALSILVSGHMASRRASSPAPTAHKSGSSKGGSRLRSPPPPSSSGRDPRSESRKRPASTVSPPPTSDLHVGTSSTLAAIDEMNVSFCSARGGGTGVDHGRRLLTSLLGNLPPPILGEGVNRPSLSLRQWRVSLQASPACLSPALNPAPLGREGMLPFSGGSVPDRRAHASRLWRVGDKTV